MPLSVIRVNRMTLSKKDSSTVLLFVLDILMGLVDYVIIDSRPMHVIYVVYTTFILFVSVAKGRKGWIRPYSLLVISFIVFVWMRYILDLVTEINIISVGGRITERNTNVVAVYLGIAISIICISAILCENSLQDKPKIVEGILNYEFRITLPKWCCRLLLCGAFTCFAVFLLDSYRKISIIRTNAYLSVSEGVMLQGYIYYTLGKYFILLWLMFSKNKNRFIIGPTIMALASSGYLMRGARGYAVMYFLTWILFLSYYVKIKLSYVIGIGIGIIFMANAILSYRMGWTIATGFMNIIFSVLCGQGSSLEQVFGSVIFHEEIVKVFNPINLFVLTDGATGYGIVVDKIRGTGFEQGGFGSSFFGEAYFLGPVLCTLFMVLAGVMCGILERAYCISHSDRKRTKGYANLMLFMTMPNLIYLGRSTIKDFIFKTIVSLIIMLFLQKWTYKEKLCCAYQKNTCAGEKQITRGEDNS